MPNSTRCGAGQQVMKNPNTDCNDYRLWLSLFCQIASLEVR